MKSVFAAASMMCASASMPFLQQVPQDIVKHKANQVNKQVQAVFRFLDDNESGACDPDVATQQKVMGSSDCKGIETAMAGMNGSGSGDPSSEQVLAMFDTMCKYGKCLVSMMKAMKEAQDSSECKAEQTSWATEFADCEAAAYPACSSGSHCEADYGEGKCTDDRKLDGDDDGFKVFEMMCARKDDETTCFEAVFKPFFDAADAISSGSNSNAGPISLDDNCALPGDGASEADVNLYICCVFEGYGCCMVAFQALFQNGPGEDDSSAFADQCPALAHVKPCPNPYKDTTYLNFDLPPVPCLGNAKGEELVLLKEGLTEAWELDSGSIELSSESDKVKVKVTVPEDKSSESVQAKIKESNINASKLAKYTNASCDVDTSAVQVSQKVVEASSTSSTLAVVSGLAILALF